MLRLVPHVGYVSLFPFMGGLIPPVSLLFSLLCSSSIWIFITSSINFVLFCYVLNPSKNLFIGVMDSRETT